jgi:hypothetical protein
MSGSRGALAAEAAAALISHFRQLSGDELLELLSTADPAAFAARIGVTPDQLELVWPQLRALATARIPFGARELTRYPHEIRASDLAVGETYFRVDYRGPELCDPALEPLEFMGTEEGRLLFRALDSTGSGAGDAPYQSFPVRGGTVSGVFEYERALEQLMLCSLRRRGLLPD